MSTSDDLTAALSMGLSVSNNKNAISSQHPRLDEFKGRYVKSGDQRNRRDEFLARQKKKKLDTINYARKLAEGNLQEEEFNEVYMEEDAEEKEHRAGSQRRKFNPYKNQLMLSEWVVDPPDDLCEKWTMVIAPVGKRVLVVAHQGQTKVYTKGGYMLQMFPSLLPGGCYSSKYNKGNFASTILDCIFDEVNKTFWMLDMMCYKGNPLYDCETDFRFFWMNTKLLEDSPNIREVSKYNKYKFIPCTNVPCDENAIVDALTDMHSFEVDGVLFYHKCGHYSPGRTPLVGWLKPYMIPEILRIPLPVSIMDKTPVEFNKIKLREANEKLQNTTSDKSFLKSSEISSTTPPDSKEIKNTQHMEIQTPPKLNPTATSESKKRKNSGSIETQIQ